MDNQAKNFPQRQITFYSGNKYQIKSVIISLIVTFTILILIPVIFYFTNNPILFQLGGDLLLRLTRIAFIILATPIAIITYFAGKRIDEAKSKTTVYPLVTELTGIILGIFFGWAISIEWAFLLTLSLGTIWADPILYAPFPVFTILITYLSFHAARLVYAKTHIMTFKQSFRIPLLFFIFSLPVLSYSAFGLYSLLRVEHSQKDSTITHFQQIQKGNSYLFTADVSVPEDNLYHVTATVGPSPQLTSKWNLRLNGAANFDGLYNFELTKGTNKFSYSATPKECQYSPNAKTETVITITISKVLDGRFSLGQPYTVTEAIRCDN